MWSFYCEKLCNPSQLLNEYWKKNTHPSLFLAFALKYGTENYDCSIWSPLPNLEAGKFECLLLNSLIRTSKKVRTGTQLCLFLCKYLEQHSQICLICLIPKLLQSNSSHHKVRCFPEELATARHVLHGRAHLFTPSQFQEVGSQKKRISWWIDSESSISS